MSKEPPQGHDSRRLTSDTQCGYDLENIAWLMYTSAPYVRGDWAVFVSELVYRVTWMRELSKLFTVLFVVNSTFPLATFPLSAPDQSLVVIFTSLAFFFYPKLLVLGFCRLTSNIASSPTSNRSLSRYTASLPIGTLSTGTIRPRRAILHPSQVTQPPFPACTLVISGNFPSPMTTNWIHHHRTLGNST